MCIIHILDAAFIRIEDSQRRWLAGDVRFDADTLVEAGLPLPMLRPESGLVLEILRAGGA